MSAIIPLYYREARRIAVPIGGGLERNIFYFRPCVHPDRLPLEAWVATIDAGFKGGFVCTFTLKDNGVVISPNLQRMLSQQNSFGFESWSAFFDVAPGAAAGWEFIAHVVYKPAAIAVVQSFERASHIITLVMD